jgi:hypothetical protein
VNDTGSVTDQITLIPCPEQIAGERQYHERGEREERSQDRQ